MNRIDRTKVEALGCELQAEVIPGQTWRWTAPCPFGRADVGTPCLHCDKLVVVGESGGTSEPYVHVGGDPVP